MTGQGQTSAARLHGGDADNAIRGFLIIAIVFGHSRLLFENIPYYFSLLYFWHVQGFFLLAYGRRAKMANIRIIDRLVRYLVPFLCVAGGITILKFAIGPHDLHHIAIAFAAMIIGSAPLIEQATGVSLFWFLPALAGFTTAIILLERLRSKAPGAPLFIPIALFTLFIVNILTPAEISTWMPLGLGLLGYLLAISIIFHASLPIINGERGRATQWVAYALTIMTLIVEITLILRGGSTNISLFVFANPPALILVIFNALATIAVNLLLFRCAGYLARSNILRTLGARSLDIFLFHQFTLFPLTLAFYHVFPVIAWPMAAIMGIVAALLSILITLLVSLQLDRVPLLRRLVFPKDAPSLICALSFGRLVSRESKST